MGKNQTVYRYNRSLILVYSKKGCQGCEEQARRKATLPAIARGDVNFKSESH